MTEPVGTHFAIASVNMAVGLKLLVAAGLVAAASAATPCPTDWTTTDGSQLPAEYLLSPWIGPFKYTFVTGQTVVTFYNYTYFMNVRDPLPGFSAKFSWGWP